MKNNLKVFWVTSIMVLMPTMSLAYIDPSIMAYGIQAIAGVIIAIGAVIGIYWRKAKKKTMDTLGIDENAKKEIEDEIVIFEKEINRK